MAVLIESNGYRGLFWKISLPCVSTPADIFLVFRTLLNCLKCIIYEDCYGWIYANRYNRNTEKAKEKRKIKWEKSKLQNVVELRD